MALPNCPLGLQEDEGLKETKGLGEKRGKKQKIEEAELILSPLCCLCILAPVMVPGTGQQAMQDGFTQPRRKPRAAREVGRKQRDITSTEVDKLQEK